MSAKRLVLMRQIEQAISKDIIASYSLKEGKQTWLFVYFTQKRWDDPKGITRITRHIEEISDFHLHYRNNTFKHLVLCTSDEETL